MGCPLKTGSRALFNDTDPYVCAWSRNLIANGLVADGDVFEGSINDITPEQASRYKQFHTFSGIAVWSHALRLAGWPDDREIWTGSCPCQPFSRAGRGGGTDDPRHLWPAWFRLIRECRPAVVVGEQVASADGLSWLDSVFADLEGAGYAVAAADLCAAGVGGPHIRQRLYFVAIRMADADESGLSIVGGSGLLDRERAPQRDDVDGRGALRGLADGEGVGRQQERENRERSGAGDGAEGRSAGLESSRDAGGLADADKQHGDRAGFGAGDDRGEQQDAREVRDSDPVRGLGDASGAGLAQQLGERGASCEARGAAQGQAAERTSAPAGSAAARWDDNFWVDVEWLPCRDGKLRPAKSGIFPLAHGATARVGKLRAAGNAIVGPLAATFILAVMDVIDAE